MSTPDIPSPGQKVWGFVKEIADDVRAKFMSSTVQTGFDMAYEVVDTLLTERLDALDEKSRSNRKLTAADEQLRITLSDLRRDIRAELHAERAVIESMTRRDPQP